MSSWLKMKKMKWFLGDKGNDFSTLLIDRQAKVRKEITIFHSCGGHVSRNDEGKLTSSG